MAVRRHYGHEHAILNAVISQVAQGLAFLFDLDGVLIDSMPMHTDAWQAYLTQLGIEQPYIAERMHGKRNSELVRELIDPALSDEAAFAHGAAKERLFREMILAADLERYRVPGVTAFLEKFRDVPKAVGSNAEPANIDFALDGLGLAPYFQVRVDGSQVKRPKPFPDIYLLAAGRLGVKPANCIVFEDSPTGVTAGVAAGMRVVGIETTPTAFEDVEFRVKNFLDPELEPWLKSLTTLA
ncbi:MAG: HAD family phosphatase [Bryobacteraceae bacterium]